MNSREVSQLFKQRQEQSDEDFHPIDTFGNRRTGSSKAPTEGAHFHEDEEQQGRPAEGHRETRIKLLTSYQESYLDSGSQGLRTEQDVTGELSRFNLVSLLSSDKKQKAKGKISQGELNSNFYRKQEPAPRRDTPQARSGSAKNLDYVGPQPKNSEGKRMQGLLDRIKVLQQAIDEETYHLSVEQRLYQYLMSRIENRSKAEKGRDMHRIVQHAVDFMDKGEDFVNSLISLKNMRS